MMKLEHLFENYDLAKAVLEHWPCDCPVSGELLSRFRISSNAVYPFTYRQELQFLRLAPVSEKLERNLRGELEFILYLRGCGYPALEPVPAKDGGLYLTLDTRWGRYFVSVFKAFPGEPLENIPLTVELARSYGKSLGRLHRLSAGFRPKSPKWDYGGALHWAEEALTRYHAPREIIAAAEALRSDLDLLPKSPELFGLVHYDFEPDNVFFDKCTNTFSVIDFDDGMYHWYAMDVEQALDALMQLPLPPGLDASGEFLAGYREEWDYSPEAEQMRPLMRRFADLFAYARILRSLSSRTASAPDWLVSLRGGLESRLAEIRRNIRG